MFRLVTVTCSLLAVCFLARPIMASGNALTCLCDDPNLSKESVNILVDEDVGRAIYFYGTAQQENMQISVNEPWYLVAFGPAGHLTINKNTGRFAYAFTIMGMDGKIFGNFVAGVCHRKAL